MRSGSCCFALLLTACSGAIADEDGRLFGEDLGRFEVDARLESSDCGPGALGSTELWEFEVQLSRDDPELYWNHGAETVVGRLEGDGVRFSFDSETVVQAEGEDDPGSGCTMVRTDSASGTLDDPGLDVRRFEGTLRYDFSAEAGSDCSAFVGGPGGLSSLPCHMTYALEAKRTSGPMAGR